MEWNVFYHNVNIQKIVPFNIFQHGRFRKDVEELLKDFDDKEDFAKQLKSELMYNFWCKSEYEVIISPWCGGRSTEDIKVDIYSQVMLNWEIFVDYVWGTKR